MSDSPDSKPTEVHPVRRVGFFLLMALVLGLPALVVNGLVSTDLDLRATVGAQPGGRIEGRLVPKGDWGELSMDEVGGHKIELYTLESGGERLLVSESITGDDGVFAFEAPPIQGKYEVAAGGGLWQRVLREGSFLDREGVPIEPGPNPIELPLRRGSSLEVVFVGAADELPISGTYDLSGELDEGAILGLLHPRFRREDEFDSGRIQIDGLPPFKGKLQIFFGVGESLSLELQVPVGVTTKRVEL